MGNGTCYTLGRREIYKEMMKNGEYECTDDMDADYDRIACH